MSVDFAALATAVVSGVSDVRTCLIVSRDGLALGACPTSEEEKALAVWSRVAALGEVERGFVALRDEVWAFCRRGPYAALATGNRSARAGVVLDALDQLLLAAEEARVRKEVLRPSQDRTDAVPEAPRGPRTSLHPGSRDESAQLATVEASSGSSLERTAVSAWVERLRAQALEASGTTVGESAAPEVGEVAMEAVDSERLWEVDRAALTREFAGLLSEDLDDDGGR
jgi:hypothetical protein